MMSATKTTPLEKILGRLDDLDADNLTILVQRLARERSLLETVFNSLHEGILVINQEGVIEYANNAATTLLGFDDKAVGKMVFWQLLPDLQRTLPSTSAGEPLGPSTTSREIELTYPEHRYVRLYLVPFHFYSPAQKNLEQERHAVILTDITQEKQSTQKQIENEKIASLFQLAAGVAHELGNPLNSLTIHLQLLQRQLEKSNDNAAPKGAQSLTICLQEVKRLDGIIRNFLEAVRPQPLDFHDLDLIAVLEEVLALQGQELADAGITVEIAIVDSPAEPPIISGDANQIKQVYFNLLKNAAQAMSGGGSIKARTYSDDGYVYITLADTGTGIAKEHLKTVFDPYFTTKKEGHGLGMMIVQRIINNHRGRIGIDSRLGIGTVITLQFPKKHPHTPMLQD